MRIIFCSLLAVASSQGIQHGLKLDEHKSLVSWRMNCFLDVIALKQIPFFSHQLKPFTHMLSIAYHNIIENWIRIA